MFRFVVLSLQLHIAFAAFPWQTENSSDVVSTLLRGSQGSSVSTNATKSSLKAGAERSEHGHLYYAESCVDCFYKNAQCGCEPAMEYLACLTKHCYASDQAKFTKTCAALSSHCFSELDIECRGPETVCQGKFHQLSTGGLGLTMDPTAGFEKAYCGPYGKCIGEVHMKVSIHNMPKKATTVTLAPAAVATPTKAPCDLDASIMLSSAQTDMTATFLECGIPNVINANIDHKEDWLICNAEVKGDFAECRMPMIPELNPEEEIESYCVLTEGEGGKKLTHPVWRNIANTQKRLATDVTDLEDEQETLASAQHSAQKGAADSYQSAQTTVDRTGDAIQDMKRASGSKPPYMRTADAEYKPEPPIIKDVKDINGEEVVRNAQMASIAGKEKAKVKAAEAKQRIAKEAADAKEPIVKDMKELDKAAEAAEKEAVEDVDKFGKKVDKEASENAETVAIARSQAAKKVEDVRDTKPPYMRDAGAFHSAPLPGVSTFVNSVVQSPLITQFAS